MNRRSFLFGLLAAPIAAPTIAIGGIDMASKQQVWTLTVKRGADREFFKCCMTAIGEEIHIWRPDQGATVIQLRGTSA